MKTQIRFVVSGDIDSPEKRFHATCSVCILSVTCWPTVHNVLLRFHCYSSYTNAPQCYVYFHCRLLSLDKQHWNLFNEIILGKWKRSRASAVCSDIHFGFGERKYHTCRTKCEGEVTRCDFHPLACCAEFSFEDGPNVRKAEYNVWSIIVGKSKFIYHHLAN